MPSASSDASTTATAPRPASATTPSAAASSNTTSPQQLKRAPDPLARFAWATGPLPGEPRNPERTAPRHLFVGRTQYFWAGDDLLAEARNDSLTEYAMWGFVSEALWENGKLRHVVNSQQGVPQELVDPSGKLVWQGTFDDWGKLVDEKGSTTCRLRLPGQLADDETGLHYNRFRYYSPEAGQFVSADPIGFEGGTNLYRFAPNATSWNDPLGLTCPGNACVKRAAADLAKKNGKNRVSVRTANTQIDIDLQGKGHFDKPSGTMIETPHVHVSEIHVGAGGTSLSNKTTRPATMADIRMARAIMERRP